MYETYTLLCSEDADVIPHQKYSIRVVYCARVHFINRRYSDFLALYAAIKSVSNSGIALSEFEF